MAITSVTKDTDAISYVEDGVTKKLSISGSDIVISFPIDACDRIINIWRQQSDGHLIITYVDTNGDDQEIDLDPNATDDQTGAEIVALLEALGSGSRLSHTKLGDVGASDHHAKYLDSEAVTAAKTVKLDDFTAPDDTTDLDAAAAKHGLMPKADKSKVDGIEAGAQVNVYASIAETNTGTEASKSVTPDGLAGSNLGIRYFPCVCFDWATDVETGDGKFYFHIPPALNGMNLVYCHALVVTAGTTGTLDIQINNVTDSDGGEVDFLSTKLTVDSGETGSDTAATPYVIDTAKDDVATNDVIRIDVDAVHTTPAKGLIVTLGFQLP